MNWVHAYTSLALHAIELHRNWRRSNLSGLPQRKSTQRNVTESGIVITPYTAPLMAQPTVAAQRTCTNYIINDMIRQLLRIIFSQFLLEYDWVVNIFNVVNHVTSERFPSLNLFIKLKKMFDLNSWDKESKRAIRKFDEILSIYCQ